MTKNRKGMALVITLWILALLGVLAMNFALTARQGSASARNFKEESEAYYAALTAYDEAVSYIKGDVDPQVDFMDKQGVFWVDNVRMPVSGRKTINNIEVEIIITDEESKLNINALNDPIFRRLFSYSRIPDDEVQGLIDSIEDWKDTDNLHRLSGAETDYYESLDVPYKAKNKPLDAPEELLLLKGFKTEYVYGGKDFEPVYPIITAQGAGININTASSAVLEIAGLSPPDIENAMKYRDKDIGGIRTGLPASATPGLLLTLVTASSGFKIEVKGFLPNSSQAVKITSIVRRTPGQDLSGLKTIYWKEGFEGSRS